MRARNLAAVVVVALPVVGLAPAAAASVPASPEVSKQTWEAYGDAIADAAVSRPGEVVQDLLVPTPADPRTQWQTFDGEQYLLVQTVSYKPVAAVASGEEFAADEDIWIAVPGEMEEACAKYRCTRLSVDELDLIFKQVIGLPPDADYSVLSRFWVKPTDLVRPCTNVDPMVASCPQLMVNTMAGGTDWSSFLLGQGMYSWRVPRHGTPMPRISCAQRYEDTARGNCYGFPWTRLGYTYDWNPKAKDGRGVTEFVVPQGATVYLESVGTQREAFPFTR